MRYFFLIILLISTFACSNYESKVSLSNHEEPTPEKLRNAMRFHGILVAKQDENHEWYFMREGRRCPLFAYLKKSTLNKPTPLKKPLIFSPFRSH